MKLATAIIFLSLWPVLASAQDGLSLSEVAEQQQARQATGIERAREAMSKRRFEEAALAAYSVLGSNEGPVVQDEATYTLAKALYRLRAYHSALHYFARILAQGPRNPFFESSLEWCLFISRRMVDDASVNEVVARYGSDDLPTEYRDEFLFRLSRYHYTQALSIETGLVAGMVGQTQVEKTNTGGLSFSGDIFGTEGGGPMVQEKSGGGLSLGGDIFDTGASEEAAPGLGDGELTASAHLAEAEKYALRVDEKSKYGARAKFIEALVMHMRDQPNEALSRFKSVIRLSREDRAAEDERLRELAFFQLARTHFGAQQPSFSIFYYDKVSRDSREWLDAIYEESWAHFRLGEYEKALGNLLTLHAPFFDDQYFPESRILEAVVYYENCRYAEANRLLNQFLQRYEPVLSELERLTARDRTPSEYFELLDGLRNEDVAQDVQADRAILSQIVELALADRRLARLDASQSEVQRELKQWGRFAAFAGSSLDAEVSAILEEERARLVDDAGQAVRARLQEEQENIKELVQQAIRIGVETARSEQERIESQLRSVEAGPKNVEQLFVEWTDDEKLVWPFGGEYWRDELGTYELTLARSCR
ncbi:MAG: hypothetical protein ACFB9M_11590 [Myxococcota bacterium]